MAPKPGRLFRWQGRVTQWLRQGLLWRVFQRQEREFRQLEREFRQPGREPGFRRGRPVARGLQPLEPGLLRQGHPELGTLPLE